MKKYLFIFYLFFIATVNAQHFTSDLTLQQLFKSDSNSLYFNIDNYNFLWNNEFFNHYVDGYTLIGYNLRPTLEYHFTSQIKAEAGVYLQKYSGLDHYKRILPVYKVTWHTDHFAVVAGTINGTTFHRLPDQILHHELQMSNAQEDGFQLVCNKHRIFADAWVNWQSFIFAGDKKQEELYGGLSVDPIIIQNENWEINTPAAFVIFHQGGQIDSVDRSLKTLMNYTAGVQATRATGFRWADHIQVGTRLMGYRDNSPNPQSIYQAGWGILTNVKAKHKASYLSAGYWYAHKFLTMQGDPMFSCYSTLDPAYHAKSRQMLVGELHLGKNATPYFHIAFMSNAYYDLDSGRFDYTYGILMILRPSLLVKRF